MAETKNIQDQICLAKNNDKNAFSFLLETFWKDVYCFLLKRTNNKSSAEDITIESFAKAFEKGQWKKGETKEQVGLTPVQRILKRGIPRSWMDNESITTVLSAKNYSTKSKKKHI